MNNDNKQEANPNASLHYIYPSRAQQKTVNFDDVARILWARKKIIFITALIVAMVGFLFALTRSATYSFSTTVQIGTVSSGGKNELIESTDTALNKILSAYIPFVLAHFYEKQPEDGGRYKLNVSVPKKSDILIVDANGSINQEKIYKELIDNVVKKLISDHSRIINLKIKNFQVTIAHAENVFASSKDNATLIAANIARLEKTAELLRSQIAEKKRILADAVKNRDHVNSNSATGAMSVLLIDSEIQRYQQLIDTLERNLLIDLNQQRNELEKSASDNLRDQRDLQNNIDQFKNELANMSNTKAIVPVMRSSDPVGISKKMILLITVVLAGLAGVFAALVAEFLHNIILNQKDVSVK